MSLTLDIPEECFDAKPFYRTRDQAQAVVAEIKAFIKKTGEPHLWRHHTHTKPVTDARIVYLGTFDLPPSHQAPDRHAPCPCCSPRAPKYSRKGMIAWFPDEHVIRNIGPECFKTLNPDGHWEAMAQFDREEAARRTIAYLSNNLHIVPKALETINAAYAPLEALDEVRQLLHQRLHEVLHVDMWRLVRTGTLMVNVTGRRMRRHRDGTQTVEDFLDEQPFAAFAAHQMFSPKESQLASRLRGTAKKLSFLDFGDELQERLRSMSDADRAKAARHLSTNLNNAAGILEEAISIRRGFRADNVAILKGWFNHPGCPVHLHVSIDGGNFYIGKSELQQLRIELPEGFWKPLGELPKIATVTQWED